MKDYEVALRALYMTSPASRKILLAFTDYQRAVSVVSVDRMVDKCNLRRAEVIATFRALESFGLGRFIKGRRPYKSRFRPNRPIYVIGSMARPVRRQMTTRTLSVTQ